MENDSEKLTLSFGWGCTVTCRGRAFASQKVCPSKKTKKKESEKKQVSQYETDLMTLEGFRGSVLCRFLGSLFKEITTFARSKL